MTLFPSRTGWVGKRVLYRWAGSYLEGSVVAETDDKAKVEWSTPTTWPMTTPKWVAKILLQEIRS